MLFLSPFVTAPFPPKPSSLGFLARRVPSVLQAEDCRFKALSKCLHKEGLGASPQLPVAPLISRIGVSRAPLFLSVNQVTLFPPPTFPPPPSKYTFLRIRRRTVFSRSFACFSFLESKVLVSNIFGRGESRQKNK